MEVLDNIRKVMLKKHISQTELCNKLGIHTNSFTNWKSGLNASYKKYLPQIADFLGVSVDYLLGRESAAKNISKEDLKALLFEGEEDITDEMLEEVKRYAKYVVSERKNKK